MMAFVLLLAQISREDSGISGGLRYLARHQREDGSWGKPPPSCRCPSTARIPKADTASEEPERRRIEALIERLTNEDPDQRDAAHSAIAALGTAAVPLLRRAEERRDWELRGRCRNVLEEIGRSDCEPDFETTALAILAFLGAGYSREPAVQKGVAWLIARQTSYGAFRSSSAAAQAVAALALSEMYEMTGWFKDPAQNAVAFVEQMPAGDARTAFSKGMALKSAEISGLTVQRESFRPVVRRIRSWDDDFSRAGNVVLTIFFERRRDAVDLSTISALDPGRLDFETRYAVGLAFFQFDGPHGPQWTRWNKSSLSFSDPDQDRARDSCGLGSWPEENFRDRLRRTALETRSRE